MIRLGWLAALAATLAPPASAQSVDPAGRGADEQRIALIARLRPAIVHVRVTRADPPQTRRDDMQRALDRIVGADRGRAGQGSGFIVDSARGLVLTAAHIVANGANFQLTGADSVARPARLIVSDPHRGFALLQADGLPGPAIPLSTAMPRAGESIAVLGYMLPTGSLLALDGMVMGNLAVPSDVLGSDASPGPYTAVSATIPNGGFGGAPVVDRDGRAIGFVSAIYGRDFGASALTMTLPLAPLAPIIASHRTGQTAKP